MVRWCRSDGKIADYDQLKQSDKQLRAELEAQRRLVANRRSPLDDIRIASPCSADWSKMVGDDHVRHCGECDKDVYNLSALTRSEGERLLLQSEGRLCLRIYRRSDGTVLTADCPVGARRIRFRRFVVGSVGAGIFTVAAVVSMSMLVTMGKPAVSPAPPAEMGQLPVKGEVSAKPWPNEDRSHTRMGRIKMGKVRRLPNPPMLGQK